MKDVAHQLARHAASAGERLLQMQSEICSGELKEPGALVTRGDRESHEIIRAAFERDFPGTPIVMEEQANPDVLPDTYLVADELDGTALYASGLKEWGVLLALVERGAPVAGVLHQPASHRTVRAWHGGGAWLDDRRLRLDADAPLRERIALTAFNRWSSDADVAWMLRIASAALAVRGLACSIASTMEILLGNAALYANPRGGKVWDFAAAALAVQEAGGVARSPTGAPLLWHKAPMGILFAAGGGIAQEAIALRNAENTSINSGS